MERIMYIMQRLCYDRLMLVIEVCNGTSVSECINLMCLQCISTTINYKKEYDVEKSL